MTSRSRAQSEVSGQSGGPGSRPGKERARDSHLLDLEMSARYHRDRHRLYAARMGGSRPTSLRKLEELKRARELAEGSLRRAQTERKEAASRGKTAGGRVDSGTDRAPSNTERR